jgi:hypothetical protein
MCSTHGEDQLEGSGTIVGHANDVVIIVRNVANVQILCPICGK